MSYLAIEWAETAPVATVYERVILQKLAHHARPDGERTYPTQRTIAAIACCDAKSVQRHLGALIERGLVRVSPDQTPVAGYRADKRPVVYDLLIPYSWFSQAQLDNTVNPDRADRGRPPLTPHDRPDIAPPPPKKRRSDAGKNRRTEKAGGLSDPPPGNRQNGQRGDSQSSAGGLSVQPRGDSQSTKQVNREQVNKPSPSTPHTKHPPSEPDSARGAGGEPPSTTSSSTTNADVSAGGAGRAASGDGHSAAAVEFLAGLPRPWRPGGTAREDLAPLVARALRDGWDAGPLREFLTAPLPGGRRVEQPVKLLRSRLKDLPELPGDDSDTVDVGPPSATDALCPDPDHDFQPKATCPACRDELRAEHGIRRNDWRAYGTTPHEALAALTRRRENSDDSDAA